MIVSFYCTGCLLFLLHCSQCWRNGFVFSWTCLPWSVSKKKNKDRKKVVYKRTSVKMLLSVLCIPHLTPRLQVSLSFISLLFFLTLSVSLFSLSSFFSLSPLSAAITDFFLPRLKYEYFRGKKLKANNEMVPKLNYTLFPESQKRDFAKWWAHRCHMGVSLGGSF